VPKLDYISNDNYNLAFLDLHTERSTELRVTRSRTVKNFACLILLVIACAGIAMPLCVKITAAYSESKEIEKSIHATAQQDARVRTQSLSYETQITQWNRFVASRNSRIDWETAVLRLGATMPTGVCLDQIQITRNAGVATLAAGGFAVNMKELSLFLRMMSSSRIYSDVHLEESSADTTAGPHGVSFTINGTMSDLVPPPSDSGS
jgi:hypothetical protein